MANKKVPAVDTEHIGSVMGSVREAVTPRQVQTVEEPPKTISLHVNAGEYAFLKSVFESKGKGLKLSSAIKMAALFIAEQVDAGAISISKAGIVDRRG